MTYYDNDKQRTEFIDRLAQKICVYQKEMAVEENIDDPDSAAALLRAFHLWVLAFAPETMIAKTLERGGNYLLESMPEAKKAEEYRKKGLQ